MAQSITPFARALYVCDYVIGYENGKMDIYGLINAIRPDGYPHTQNRFCVFAQLVGGLGNVPFSIDIIYRPLDGVVWSAKVRHLRFPSREVVVQMVAEIRNCTFPDPGPYLLELYCNGVAVADVPLLLLKEETSDEA